VDTLLFVTGIIKLLRKIIIMIRFLHYDYTLSNAYRVNYLDKSPRKTLAIINKIFF